MEMCLLDTLTMVTLRVGQTEQTLLQEVARLLLVTRKRVTGASKKEE
jgi:hypothetical protein